MKLKHVIAVLVLPQDNAVPGREDSVFWLETIGASVKKQMSVAVSIEGEEKRN